MIDPGFFDSRGVFLIVQSIIEHPIIDKMLKIAITTLRAVFSSLIISE